MQTFRDDDGTLSVTVPRAWARQISPAGWVPSGEAFNESALSVGDGREWQKSGQGVFVGLIQAPKLPTKLPQHPECSAPGGVKTNSPGHDPSVTETSTGCTGGGVVIEKAVQVNASTLMWIQVRSDHLATADAVLESVQARSGL
jgi:hypothetical protein